MRLESLWRCTHAPDEGDAELLQPPPFASLDADCLRFVAACLPRRRLNFPINSECLDARSPSLVAMASASKFLREALKSLMAAMRRAHEARIDSLAAFARDAGTSWGALGRAGDLFRSRGSGQCASCGGCYPKSGGLFLREEEGAAARDEAAERPADLRLAAGLCHCAHCWRTAFGRSARENTWEGPAGEQDMAWTLMRVEDGVYQLDSPLVTREEHSKDWEEPAELVAELRAAGWVLDLAGPAPRADGEAGGMVGVAGVPAGGGSRTPAAPSAPWSPLAIDLLASGYGDHLLSLDLSHCGLDDAGLDSLSAALVGNCLSLAYLDLSNNPIGDEGVSAMSRRLSPRRYDMMLPLLKYMHLLLGRLSDAGAIAFAEALRGGALPSLELLWCCGEYTATMDVGFSAMTGACEWRGLVLELDHGFVWGS